MVTICADGEELPPTVIYKGQHFSTEWHQNNTLNASIAHSPKGWTDGVIGQLWIEDFNRKTHAKANGRAWLLLVDGHNSHYTKDFLDYARENNIHILCYPAHTTHIYQGLDVCIFGVLKHYWTLEHDQYLKDTRQKVGKGNFLAIYSRAHQKALTPETIRAAFQKTGVWPLNPNVVPKEMMAHSYETSSVGHMPLPQASPVCAVLKAIYEYQLGQHTESPDTPWHLAAHKAAEALASTSASYLVNTTPLTSENQLPTYQPSPLTPTQ